MFDINQIRENEEHAHITMYKGSGLYQPGSWLAKPVKTVLNLLSIFRSYSDLRVLDLGCGVGRNCIAIAKYFQNIPCTIDCVDILDLAIEELEKNAELHGVSQSIHGIMKPIEDFSIPQNEYDWIIAVSALEHVDSEHSFFVKLKEIAAGIREHGMVTLVINSNIQEIRKSDGSIVVPQFEVNMQTNVLQNLLEQVFSGWNIVTYTVRRQSYDIPRANCTTELITDVVTFAARKQGRI